MFTLKIASGDTLMWFADVAQVSKIAASTFGDVTEIMDLWCEQQCYNPAIYVSFESSGPNQTGPRSLRSGVSATLLWVVYGQGASLHGRGQDEVHEQYLAVEYAWLLGPNGDTIDRVAP